MNTRTQNWVIWTAGLLVAAVGARLGFWQLDRAAQKTALQQAILMKKQDVVTDFIGLIATESVASQKPDWARHIHRPITLVGRWQPQHTVLLDNRQMNGRPGFFVLTPLVLDSAGRSGDPSPSVMVQRGWVPRDFLMRDRVAEVPTPSGRVTVLGRIAGPPARLLELGGRGAVEARVDPNHTSASAPGSAQNSVIRQNLDLTEFAADKKSTLPQLLTAITVVQVDATPAQNDVPTDGLRRQWPEPDAGVAKHHGYAFQWFALAWLALGLLIWFRIIAPRRAPADSPSVSPSASPFND